MTPKKRFLEGPHAKTFADISGSEAFKSACGAAMLALVEATVGKDDPQAHGVLKGARDFRRILETIALPEEEPVITKTPNLRYDAYERTRRNA